MNTARIDNNSLYKLYLSGNISFKTEIAVKNDIKKRAKMMAHLKAINPECNNFWFILNL